MKILILYWFLYPFGDIGTPRNVVKFCVKTTMMGQLARDGPDGPRWSPRLPKMA